MSLPRKIGSATIGKRVSLIEKYPTKPRVAINPSSTGRRQPKQVLPKLRGAKSCANICTCFVQMEICCQGHLPMRARTLRANAHLRQIGFPTPLYYVLRRVAPRFEGVVSSSAGYFVHFSDSRFGTRWFNFSIGPSVLQVPS